jgi:sugar lactone lactonase YvrE
MSNKFFNFTIPSFNQKYGSDWTDFNTITEDNFDYIFRKTWELYYYNDVNTLSNNGAEAILTLLKIPFDETDTLQTKKLKIRKFVVIGKEKSLEDQYLDIQEEIVGTRGIIHTGLDAGGWRWGNNTWRNTQGTLISSFLTSVYDASATTPQGLSVDSSNNTLWVCDSATNKIYNITKAGALQSSFLTSVYDASATGSSGISVDSSNNTLWVCDSATNKIYNITKAGALINSFPTSTYDASAIGSSGISVDSSNNTLWVCDESTDKIYNISKTGTLQSSFPTSVFDAGALGLKGIGFDSSNDTLWVCDAPTGKIYNISKTGTLLSSFLASVFDAGALALTGVSHDASTDTLRLCDSFSKKIYNVDSRVISGKHIRWEKTGSRFDIYIDCKTTDSNNLDTIQDLYRLDFLQPAFYQIYLIDSSWNILRTI